MSQPRIENQAPPPPYKPPQPRWVFPTITGAAGFVIGALVVGGVAMGINPVP